MLNKVKEFEKKFVIEKSEAKIDNFNVGDTITVGLKIVDNNSMRVQDFTGVCIAYRKKGAMTNIIVRKMSTDIPVERNVMIYSPLVSYIKLVRKGKVRRAKLYYIRNLRGKEARIKEKIDNKYTNNKKSDIKEGVKANKVAEQTMQQNLENENNN